MDAQRVEMFIVGNSKYFPNEKIPLVKGSLERLADSKLTAIQSIPYKDPTILLIIAIFLGGLGVDRFMLGQIGLGILKIITLGGLGIWALIDIFTAMRRAREYNFSQFSQIAQ